MHLLFVNLLNFSKKSWWIFMLSCWFLNGSKMSYICCAAIWVKIIYIFVVLFCACWSIFAPLCSFPLPSSSIPISPYLCLYLWLPFQAAWKSCWYACAEPSTSTTAPFSSTGSLPQLTSSKHLVRIRWECRCASSKAFRYHESFLCEIENLQPFSHALCINYHKGWRKCLCSYCSESIKRHLWIDRHYSSY